MEFVDQLHDRGDTSIKMPSSLEIIGNAFDGLMKFPLYLSCLTRQLSRGWFVPIRMSRLRIAVYKAKHTSQKSLDALNPCVLPIQIAVRRRSKQAVHARRIRAITFHHLIR